MITGLEEFSWSAQEEEGGEGDHPAAAGAPAQSTEPTAAPVASLASSAGATEVRSRRGAPAASRTQTGTTATTTSSAPAATTTPAAAAAEDNGAKPVCAVCLGTYVAGERVTRLPCHTKHIFHTQCVIPWLRRNRACPLCQVDIDVSAEEGASRTTAPAAAAEAAADR